MSTYPHPAQSCFLIAMTGNMSAAYFSRQHVSLVSATEIKAQVCHAINLHSIIRRSVSLFVHRVQPLNCTAFQTLKYASQVPTINSPHSNDEIR
jgi:hypothetical protein